MAKNVNVSFDENSEKILKEVDEIHRNSLINIGLALASRTEYYKTLTGTPNPKLTKVASLGSLDELEEELEDEVKPKAKTVVSGGDDWDNF